MLRSVQIANFKAFSLEERVRIAPITLIYGANSSGKTSVIQALLLLLQTLESEDDPGILLSPKGTLVDLGGFREFVYGHDLSRTFSVLVEVDPSAHQPRRNAPQPARYRAFAEVVQALGSVGLRFSFRYDENRRAVALVKLDVFVGSISIGPLASFIEQRSQRPDELEPVPGELNPIRVPIQTMRISSVDWSHPYWRAVYARTGRRDAKALRELYDSLISIKRETVQGKERAPGRTVSAYQWFLRQGHHNPFLFNLRDPVALAASLTPAELERRRQRYSVYTSRKAVEDFREENKDATVGLRNFLPSEVPVHREPSIRAAATKGERLYDLSSLAAFAAGAVRQELLRIVYLGPLREYPERHYIFTGARTSQVGKSGKLLPDVLFTNRGLVGELNDELKAFGIPYDLRVSSVVDDDPTLEDVFAMRLIDRSRGVHVSIRDVGFGISQALPVIAQSMLSRRSLICIEQPEIHLHPRLQAELAELFVRCLPEPRANAFLIETHSEHMMLRLQRLIRERRLDPKDVSVVYVDSAGESTRAVQLRLDTDGEFIDQWPDGFFEEGFREMFGTPE
jgi:hypothetical protein